MFLEHKALSDAASSQGTDSSVEQPDAAFGQLTPKQDFDSTTVKGECSACHC